MRYKKKWYFHAKFPIVARWDPNEGENIRTETKWLVLGLG